MALAGFTSAGSRPRVIEQLVVRGPLPMRKLVGDTRRCRWFASAQAVAAFGREVA